MLIKSTHIYTRSLSRKKNVYSQLIKECYGNLMKKLFNASGTKLTSRAQARG